MAKYAVLIRYEYITEVEANDEDEACDLARDEASSDVVGPDDLFETDVSADLLEGVEDEDEDEDEDEEELEDEEEDDLEPEDSGVFPLDEEAQSLIAQIKPE